VADEKQYTIALQGFHYKNSEGNMGIPYDDLIALAPPKVIATSMRDVVEEYMRSHQGIDRQVEGRLVYKN
jgi:5'-nucleotidase